MATTGAARLLTSGTTTSLPISNVDSYDYLIVGGGTAGCVIASRLAEYLPHRKILLIEAGPSDYMDDRVLDLKQWLSLLGGELDYDYGTTEQPNGTDFRPPQCNGDYYRCRFSRLVRSSIIHVTDGK